MLWIETGLFCMLPPCHDNCWSSNLGIRRAARFPEHSLQTSALEFQRASCMLVIVTVPLQDRSEMLFYGCSLRLEREWLNGRSLRECMYEVKFEPRTSQLALLAAEWHQLKLKVPVEDGRVCVDVWMHEKTYRPMSYCIFLGVANLVYNL